MTARECHHDSTTHDYLTLQHHSRTLRIDRVCDRCDKTLQTFWANAEEVA